MRSILTILTVANMLFGALPAGAEDVTAQPAKPAQPCQRGETMIRMAGVDLDEMKCHYAVALQQLAAMSLEIVDRDARLRMATNDLAASKDREKSLVDELAKLKADKPAAAQK